MVGTSSAHLTFQVVGGLGEKGVYGGPCWPLGKRHTGDNSALAPVEADSVCRHQALCLQVANNNR